MITPIVRNHDLFTNSRNQGVMLLLTIKPCRVPCHAILCDVWLCFLGYGSVLVSWCANNRHIQTAPEHLLTAPEDL